MRELVPPQTGNTQNGSALVTALIVLVLLSVMGITLLFISDSDAKMNKAGVRAKKSFYLAEAGLEVGRKQLRDNNLTSTNKTSLSDELTVGAGANGVINFDPATVKPTYDSSGNVTGFTGYGDDVPLVASTSFAGGRYATFLTNDAIDGRTALADSNSRVVVTAIGAGSDRSTETVQAVVTNSVLPGFPATITILGPTADFNGGTSNSKTYTGNDCQGATGYTGIPGLSVPVIGTIGGASQASAQTGVIKPPSYTSGTEVGTATVHDVTSTINPFWTDCNSLRAMASTVQASADYVCTTASPCSHWGTSTINTVTFVDGDLSVGDGKGVLWVTGTLNTAGNSSWEGIIIVVGKGVFIRSGGGNGSTWGAEIVANIAGPDGVYGNGDDCTGGTGGFGVATHNADGMGNHDTAYCSDAISQALNGFPLPIRDFRQR